MVLMNFKTPKLLFTQPVEMSNEFFSSQPSAWKKTKSHKALNLGNKEGGHELLFVFLTKSCLTLIALCAGVLSWWRSHGLPLHSSHLLCQTWLWKQMRTCW